MYPITVHPIVDVVHLLDIIQLINGRGNFDYHFYLDEISDIRRAVGELEIILASLNKVIISFCESINGFI